MIRVSLFYFNIFEDNEPNKSIESKVDCQDEDRNFYSMLQWLSNIEYFENIVDQKSILFTNNIEKSFYDYIFSLPDHKGRKNFHGKLIPLKTVL